MPSDSIRKYILPGAIIQSPYSGNAFKILGLLGEGGFGEAFLAQCIKRTKVPEFVCLKVAWDIASWHREAYFGELLRGKPRVIQMLEAFPLEYILGAQRRQFFALVSTYAKNGCLRDYLEKNGPWSEDRAKKEIIALLGALDDLHAGGALHRDLTPANVLVDAKGHLHLSDFGIARHAVGKHPIEADAFNPGFVTKGFLNREHRYWLAVDDVFQMGQILALLLRGNANCTVSQRDVDRLQCSDSLKSVILKAIGPRRERYFDAYAMRQALSGRREGVDTNVVSLEGRRVAFTGRLSMKRFDASILAMQAGATVVRRITKLLNVLVVGRRTPLYRYGIKGKKLVGVERLNRNGANIKVISEDQFERLVRKVV